MESKLQRPMEQCNIIVETSRKCMINVIILGSYLVLLLCEEAKEWRFFMLSSCRWVEHKVVRHRTCSYHSNIYIMRMVNSSVYATCDHRKVFRNMISVVKGEGFEVFTTTHCNFLIREMEERGCLPIKSVPRFHTRDENQEIRSLTVNTSECDPLQETNTSVEIWFVNMIAKWAVVQLWSRVRINSSEDHIKYTPGTSEQTEIFVIENNMRTRENKQFSCSYQWSITRESG